MKRTKIICTIGPASDNKDIVLQLIKNGMNASRHNFSHGDHEEHKKRFDMVKELRKELNAPIAIVLDTKGPEIRTGNFKEGKVQLEQGSKFIIVCNEEILGDKTICSVTYDKLCEDVKPGDSILIDDGLVGLKVQEIEDNKIICEVKNSGMIGNHKGVNVPGVSTKLPALTEKDMEDLKFGIEQEVDIIAASFIRKASDVLAMRKFLEKNGGHDIQIFSKIENQEGVDNIDEIIKFSDGIMVARGDLGVEIPAEKVPLVQKMIISKCNNVGKSVITATQMLDSMIRNPRPTRAEASDVANAIIDGTDAIMLSGETANGKYPIEALKTMAKIAEETENSLHYEEELKSLNKIHVTSVPNSISYAACTIAMNLNASAIITTTKSGSTAKRVSRYRPKATIIAVTTTEKVARRLALNWGVKPLITSVMYSTDEIIEKSVEIALKAQYVKKGDLVVIAAGIPLNYTGSTNMIKVHVVGDVLLQGKGVGMTPAFGTAIVAGSVEEAEDKLGEDDILVVKNLDKGYINLLDKVAAIISEEGGLTSHTAIQCISREIPIICGAKDALNIIKTGSFITVDGGRGVVYSGRTNIK